MEFKKWFTDKYLDWEKEGEGLRGKVRFAEWLDIPYPQVSNYISGNYKPKTANVIGKIADKLGYEVYDILQVDRPSYEIEEFINVPSELRSLVISAFREIDSALSSAGSDAPLEERVHLAQTIMAKHGLSWTDISKSGNDG